MLLMNENQHIIKDNNDWNWSKKHTKNNIIIIESVV